MRDSDASSGLRPSTFGALFALLFSLSALPVLLGDTLPLFDYPNHLARMHLLATLPRSAALQQFYEIVWQPLPNLAMDVIVPPLAQVMPLAWAGKIFVLLCFLALSGGAAILHRVVAGRWSAWPLLVFFLLYSRVLLWGLLNYLLGVGLIFVALAVWIALRERHPLIRLAAGSVAALALFFTHLMAFGLYGVMVAGYELGRLLHRRSSPLQAALTLLLAGLPFIPALAILVFATPGAAGVVAFGQPLRKLDLLFSVFDNYSRPFDIICFVGAVAGLALAYLKGWIRLNPAMAGPVTLLGLVYLVTPSQLFTAASVDHRIPLVLAVAIIAGSDWAAPRLNPRRLFTAAASVLFLLRLGMVAVNWQASERSYAELQPAFDRIPVGSRVAVAYSSASIHSERTPLTHFPLLAVVARDAFVPTLFAYPTQQPVALKPAFRALADRLPPDALWSAFLRSDAPLEAKTREALEACDFVIFLDRRPFTLAVTTGLEAVFTTPRFQLFRITREAAGLDDKAGGR